VRLLDQIAQHPEPFLVRQNDGRVLRLAGAGDFAALIQRCPLRYVLADELTRDCTALAYSDGARLADCLDLVHMPAREWWVEWNDEAREQEYRAALCLHSPAPGLSAVVRAGAYIRAEAGGRSGVMRTFWSCRDQPNDPLLAPLEIHFDLDAAAQCRGSLNELLNGTCVSVPIVAAPGVCEVLQRARYRLDPGWLSYYRGNLVTAGARQQVLSESLGTVAADFPVVVALLLMMTVRGGLPQRREDLVSLNTKRSRLGKPPLLEHIEMSSPVVPLRAMARSSDLHTLRRTARLHHVRGHLVRRANLVFWRTPHWRGHLRLGQVRSRTITLRS
jgi:hypothetical protein